MRLLKCWVFGWMFLLLCAAGCLSLSGLNRVDSITGRILEIEDEISAKVLQVRSGEITLAELEAFVAAKLQEVKDLKAEIKEVKASEGIGWPELIGAILASIFGSTGIIRAWRGSSHKGQGLTLSLEK